MMEILLLPLLLAHPYHVSLAEMEFNAKSARWEVALRLHPGDLDAALSRQQQRRVVLENESPEAARRMAEAYLNKRFRILGDKPARQSTLRWVGMEMTNKFVWWYFELQPADLPRPLRLENRVLMEIEPTQVNTVNLLGGIKTQSLVFTAAKSVHPLPAP